MTGDLVCCICCGRDTRAKDGVCAFCRGRNSLDHSEENGRKGRRLIPVAGSCLHDRNDDDDDPAAVTRQYRGESIRAARPWNRASRFHQFPWRGRQPRFGVSALLWRKASTKLSACSCVVAGAATVSWPPNAVADLARMDRRQDRESTNRHTPTKTNGAQWNGLSAKGWRCGSSRPNRPIPSVSVSPAILAAL